MRHRVYKLSSPMTILGLAPSELFLIIISWAVFTQVLELIYPSRLNLVFSPVLTYGVFKAWTLVRDNVPDKFFTHLVTYMGEADEFQAMPDSKTVPLVVDVDAVREREDADRGRANPQPKRRNRRAIL